jgi:NAD(P)-dependent dehydrogenase (short-subunit alcohol dehydrogenase family)
MAQRAAIVTGASSGIGYAIAGVLVQEGFGLTLAARRPEKLAEAAARLRAETGAEIQDVAANVADEEQIRAVVEAHRERFGRCDVLVNNAGIGIGAPVGEIVTKRLDTQLDVNLRSMILFYREALDLLQAAAAEHRNALVVNTASVAGKRGEAWLSVYSAAKFGMIGFTQAMNKELAGRGIKSTALAPAFVDTAMTEFIKGQVSADEMIRPQDIAESVRFLLRLSPACIVPELVFLRPGDEV